MTSLLRKTEILEVRGKNMSFLVMYSAFTEKISEFIKNSPILGGYFANFHYTRSGKI